jgi:hypothetical protein
MNGKPVISSKSLDRDFDQLLAENPQLQQVLPLMPDAKQNFMQGMVSQIVVDKYVEDNGLDKSDDYKKEYDRLKVSVKRMLNAKYFDKDNTVDIADADIEKFYNERKDTTADFVMSRGGVKAMGVPFAKEDAARAFMGKAKGKDFAKVAKEHGLAGKMRDFKMVNEQSVGMDNAIKNRIVAMKQCPCLEMVKGDDKMFWIVSASEKQNVVYRPLEQVKSGIKQYLENERRMASRDKKINGLKEQYKVAVNTNYFEAPKNSAMAQTEEVQDGAMPAVQPGMATKAA